MRNNDVLFWEYDWRSVTEAQKAALCKKVNTFEHKHFVESSMDELAARLEKDFSLAPPQIDRENITIGQREVNIDLSGERGGYFSRSGGDTVKGTAIDVRVPFSGDRGMFRIKPTQSTSPPRAKLGTDCLEFTISGVNLAPERVKSEIEERVNRIAKFLQFQEESIGSFPEELRRIAYDALEQRKKKLEADDNLVSQLGYKVT